jgi:hypothetical protein
MHTVPKTFLTPEEYLEQERRAEFKSEYYQGETFAMAGATVQLTSINCVLPLSEIYDKVVWD